MNALGNVGIAIFVVVALAVVVATVATAMAKKKVSVLRARGLYPEEGKAAESDVVRLLQAGEKIMAIRCYRALHNVGLKEAKDAVELLEKKNA